MPGSRLGWAAFDLLAGLACGSYACVDGPLAGVSPGRGLLPALLGGLVFGGVLASFTALTPGAAYGHKVRAGAELFVLVTHVSLSALVVGAFFVLAGFGTTTLSLIESEICCMLLLTMAARIFWRARCERKLRRRGATRNFAIAGLEIDSDSVRDYLVSLGYAGYKFKGYILLDETDRAKTGAVGADVLGSIQEIMPLARAQFIDEIFFVRRPGTAALKTALEQARVAGINIRLIPDISETLERRSDIHYVGDLPTVVLHQSDTQEIARLVKRLLDIVGAGAALLLLLPVGLCIALLVRTGSAGAILYRSERVGLRGRLFSCLKFRSMVWNAGDLRETINHLNEREGVLFKIAKDPRITRVGALLRRYSLDELPQFWNVLRGDMSLVGPRPPVFSEVEQYTMDQFCRLEVQPGITGLWQVEARQDPSFESYIELDRKYVNDWSVWLDLKILFRTVAVVIGGTGT